MKAVPPSHETALYRRTGEVLHYLWDPCGISDAPQARDEYDSYLPSVYSVLHQGADAAKIAALLTEIEGKYTNLVSQIVADVVKPEAITTESED